MGCGSSKDENPDAIKSEMKKTLIPSYDEVFKTSLKFIIKHFKLYSYLRKLATS